MGQTLTIKSATHSYQVVMEKGSRFRLAEQLKQHTPGYTKTVLIIDKNVADLYKEDFLSSFAEAPQVIEVASGERSKSFETYHQLVTKLLEAGLDRKAVVVAIGGGVVGDVAGFVAATYMRGIRFIQVPTTILAHDSSVGGKTGINHPLGKNLIGAFHAPSAVLYDPEILESLPEAELRSGFAEVIKHGLIHDRAFYTWLVDHIHSLTDLHVDMLGDLLLRSIKVKADVVEVDEKEQGIRAHLNFGHTLGHAIEAELGYGQLTHGEAVAIGMIFAMKLSEKVLHTTLPIDETSTYLQRLGYETSLRKGLTIAGLIDRMKLDKKASSGNMQFVLLSEVGIAGLYQVQEEVIESLLQELIG
ncbi:3-dehydroquinate synthase [Paenalkalicoccus suaedae]|uniref:3-dehydroquinate synthase n=1 Tax=Paenalkalicoccus suaedae TaxID=2592382 RepID=A0A859FFT5_9BACI|nr:3-dehydroquinate synthase [Paenalkalicoccus suaedae]QKS71096.1 3-dehydroquinate synthase [Paenalkalicoccus suaedae]